MTKIQTVGIVGAGTMGQGIAQACAMAGFHVLLYDVNQGFLKKSFSILDASLQGSVDKGKLTSQQKQEALDKIKPCENLEQVKADLIIEAAIESLEIKRNIFKTLEECNSPQCILTTN